MTTDATASGAASASTRPKSARWSLAVRISHRRLSLACIGLFYLYMLAPGRVQEQMALFRLETPSAAAAFGLGHPYLTILDLAMLALGGFVLVGSSGRRPRGEANWPLIIYVTLCALCAAVPWAAHGLGLGPASYWDSPLAALRVIAAYILFAAIPGDFRSLSRHLQNALALVFLTSFALNLGGFSNPAIASNEAGRLTASGLDFATTSYLGCALALSALTLSRGLRQLALFALGMLGLAMGAGRSAVVVFIPALVLVALQRFLLRRDTVASLSLAAVLALPLALAVPFSIDRLPLLNRPLDYSVYYRVRPALTTLAHSTFPGVDHLPLSDPALVSRINAWATGIDLLRRSRGLPLGSDWLIQQQLAPLGVPSHSHNAYLQTALKFGPLAVCLWAAWFLAAWRGLRARSPLSAVVVLFLLSLFPDYCLLVTKATFVLFAFIRLDALWRAERAARTGVSAPAGAPAS